MSINIGNKKSRLYIGNIKVSKAYLGSTKIYSSGNIVTYYIDLEISYQEEVDEGESCLAPATFTPAKDGWEFVGWRLDSGASATVLDSLVMGDDPIILYAVFKQDVTLSYNGNGNTGGSTAAQSGTRYYNNGNVTNPTFSLQSNGFSRSGYNFVKWAMGSSGGTQYSAGATVTLSENATFYAVWIIYAKNAPPFNGWDSTTSDRSARDNGTYLEGGNWRGTGYWEGVSVSENAISAHVQLNPGEIIDLIFFSPVFSTSNYNKFNVECDSSFGNYDYSKQVIRYSNNKSSWTNWFFGNTISHEYEFAQVGRYFVFSADSDETTVTGYLVGVHSASFS